MYTVSHSRVITDWEGTITLSKRVVPSTVLILIVEHRRRYGEGLIVGCDISAIRHVRISDPRRSATVGYVTHLSSERGNTPDMPESAPDCDQNNVSNRPAGFPVKKRGVVLAITMSPFCVEIPVVDGLTVCWCKLK